MQINKWDKSDLAVALTTLYLRLNGYFTVVGLIIHSPKHGDNKTDIDCLGIRHAFHDQEERVVGCDAFLSIPKHRSDVILCEIKSNEKIGEFNAPLLKDKSNLNAALRWSGVLENQKQVTTVVDQLHPLLASGIDRELAVKGVTSVDRFSFRALLSCPAAQPDDKSWCLTEAEIFSFLYSCLVKKTNEPRPCSTVYDLGLWGKTYEPLVDYVKKSKGQNLTFKQLLQSLS